MSVIDVSCGRIGMHAISICAERAAEAIAGRTPARVAVCLSPDGFVTAEEVQQAIPDDVVGVYEWRPGKLRQVELWQMIEDDLLCAAKQRGIRGGASHRHTVRRAA